MIDCLQSSTFAGYLGAFCLGALAGMCAFAYAAVTEESKRVARYLPQEGDE